MNETVAYSRYWPRCKIDALNDKAFIVAPHQRDAASIEVTLRNILSFNSSSWRIIVLTSSLQLTLMLQVARYIDPNIEVVVKDEMFDSRGELDLEYYHRNIHTLPFLDSLQRNIVTGGGEKGGGSEGNMISINKFCVVHKDCFLLDSQFHRIIDSFPVINSFTIETAVNDICICSNGQQLQLELAANVAPPYGDGGLIVRTREAINSLGDLETIDGNVLKFMKAHGLTCLPEFYLFETSVCPDVYRYHATQSYIEHPYWICSPERLNDWQNFLKWRLTPYFHMGWTTESRELSVLETESESYHSSIGYKRRLACLEPFLVDQRQESRSLQIIRGGESNTSGQLSIYLEAEDSRGSQPNIERCLGAVYLDQLVRLSPHVRRYNLFYQRLTYLLDRYNIIGKPYRVLNNYSSRTGAGSTRVQTIYFYDTESSVQPNKASALRGEKVVLIIDGLESLEKYAYCHPLLTVTRYRRSYLEELTDLVYIDRYIVHGKYRGNGSHCLLIPPMFNMTIDEIDEIVARLAVTGDRPNLVYIKQRDHHIADEYISDRVSKYLIKGHLVLSNLSLIHI